MIFTTASTSRATSGGSTVKPIEKIRMSPEVLERATQKSALLPSRSSSGCTNANAHSAPRWAPPSSSSPSEPPLRVARILPARGLAVRGMASAPSVAIQALGRAR